MKKRTTRTGVRLFNQLMKLCDNPAETAKFFYRDDVTGMCMKVRIFSYHVANYSDWIKPGALECRGIMFEIDDEGKPIRILSRPMEKFFNIDENPLSMNLDYSSVLFYMTKEDGSLISSFDDQGYLGLKSKTSLRSDQVAWAFTWLSDHPDLKARVLELAQSGYTVNFEYVGPNNRIVLGYSEPSLRILNVREIGSGKYVPMDEIFADAALRPYLVDVFDASDCSESWVKTAKKLEGIEGFILVFPDKMAKLKTDWYVSLHHTKDSVNNNKRLMECCIDNVTDDLRQLFEGDNVALEKINDFDIAYSQFINEFFADIQSFVLENRHLDRKQYAIKAQTVFMKKHFLFGVAMTLYQGYDGDKAIELISNTMKRNLELFIPKKYQ